MDSQIKDKLSKIRIDLFELVERIVPEEYRDKEGDILKLSSMDSKSATYTSPINPRGVRPKHIKKIKIPHSPLLKKLTKIVDDLYRIN